MIFDLQITNVHYLHYHFEANQGTGNLGLFTLCSFMLSSQEISRQQKIYKDFTRNIEIYLAKQKEKKRNRLLNDTEVQQILKIQDKLWLLAIQPMY